MVSGKGRRRPTDWQPLAETDPIPGDPEDIRDEVTKMKNLAKTLRDQARILRKAEDGDALRGNYADKIREKSGELDKRFRETAGRYERVVGDLGKWANDLEGFQDRADGILRRAKHANEEHSADLKKKEAKAEKDGGDPPDYVDDSHLATYRKQLNEVTADRDAAAEKCARNIGDDISDVLEDSTWENFADGLSTTLDVLGYLGTAIAIVGIFCTPAGWIVGIGLAIGVASLLGHSLLAITGKGSWTDVAFDAIGLVTMGLGGKALTGLKASRALTKTASKVAARTGKAREVLERQKGVKNFTDRVIARHGVNSERGQMAQRIKLGQRDKLNDEMRAAERAEADAPMAQGRGLGDKEAKDLAEDAKQMRIRHSGNEVVENAAKQADEASKKFNMYWRTGTGVDVGDKAMDIGSDAIGFDGYGDLKDVPTMEVGSQW
ncbi:hypothetical protein M8I34_00200 [Streptomyces sp. MCA2]|uniref:putative T7SS-secreted protein n=1 Tax=Streptomyces sp. MCA2 TaxID=2944805 RepID=UPI0020205D4A|nr:hypothetical protein [Streptomyces sp. MCA2]MCL7489889.1 hypothetical protein [Streptomyces sp. MCA2]